MHLIVSITFIEIHCIGLGFDPSKEKLDFGGHLDQCRLCCWCDSLLSVFLRERIGETRTNSSFTRRAQKASAGMNCITDCYRKGRGATAKSKQWTALRLERHRRSSMRKSEMLSEYYLAESQITIWRHYNVDVSVVWFVCKCNFPCEFIVSTGEMWADSYRLHLVFSLNWSCCVNWMLTCHNVMSGQRFNLCSCCRFIEHVCLCCKTPWITCFMFYVKSGVW